MKLAVRELRLRLLELDVGDLGMRRYWRPDPHLEIRLPDRAGYAEQFRALFSEAVRCRLEGPDPVACLFSGGVDSSSVLCAAHAVRERSGPPIKAVVLTGLRGDDVFGGLGYLADRMGALRLAGLRSELTAWSSVVGAAPGRLFWSLCVLPWLAWARPATRLVRRPAIAPVRLARPRALPGGLARAEAIDLVAGPMAMLTTELFELNAASHGLVPAYPLWDRRVVEFLLAVPMETRIGGGVTKRLLREAMAGLAPAPNVQRRDKLSLAPFFRRGLMHEDRDLVTDALTDLHPVLAERVPPRRAARVLDDLLHGREVPLLQLWFLICANLWLRQVAPEQD